MHTKTCTTCHQPVKWSEAVQRGDGRVVRYFHAGDCIQLWGIVTATAAVGNAAAA